MRRIFKWAGLLLVAVLVLAGAFVAVAYGVSNHRLNKVWKVEGHPFAIPPADEEVLAEGKRLYFARGCVDCHGEDVSGARFLDDPALGEWWGTNLTTLAAAYSEADWDRAVRHGVKPDGRPTFFMPAHELYFISDRDMGRIVAWVNSQPVVDRTPPASKIGALARVLHFLDLFPLSPADKVNHEAPRPADLEPAPAAEFGKRLASGQCMVCHGESFSGGALPGAPPSLPAPTNLTFHESGLGSWTKAQFVTAVREGKRPDGSDIDPFMPWRTFSHLTDVEMDALWAFFEELPKTPLGNR